MRNDAKSIKQIEVGSIVQIDPATDHVEQRGLIVAVSKLESWGVIAGGFRLPWAMFEPTGGKEVWTPSGARTRETALPGRHHP